MREIPSLDLSTMFTTTPAPFDFVLPGLIAGTTGGLISPGGAGKSTFCLEAASSVACHVAGGADLLGLGETPPGNVLVLAGEDPDIALHHRIHAMGALLSPEQRQSIAEHLDIRPCAGRGIDITKDEWLRWLMEKAEGKRLVFLDTLTRFHSLDENQACDAKEIMARLEFVAVETGAAIVFPHHVSKAAALGGMSDLQQAARGSSVFVDNARWLSFLAAMTPEEAAAHGVEEQYRRLYVRWNICKQNYAEPISDRWYQRHDAGILLPWEGAIPFHNEKPANRRQKKKAPPTTATAHVVEGSYADVTF
jgi:RecA-family ATPase